ncbi:MAG: glycoside hydrolase family 15 protein, partial [Nocardioides sp.]
MNRPIEDYALLGDLQTAALVSRTGSIDWLCLPRFDAPACFAALLGTEENGHWRIAPTGVEVCSRRSYRGDTLVLDTIWETETGTVRVVDYMPPRGEAPDLVRLVEGVSGRVEMTSHLRVRLDYGNVKPYLPASGDDVLVVAGPDALWLTTPVPVTGAGEGLDSVFTVSAGESVSFVLTHHPSHLGRPTAVEPHSALDETMAFWIDWIDTCAYHGQWEADVRRALVTLKALTYAPTGGILAAATASLPEVIGGVRNWDYRYCWLRDATFTLQALLGTGHLAEARAWREWLVRAVAGEPSKLQIMYALDGARRLNEADLNWLPGYRGSTPVRIGNAAADQHQLDTWGEVLVCLDEARVAGLHPAESAWRMQTGLMDWLESNWSAPDNGLWEIRGERRQFVHSKALAWAGADRMIRTAEAHDMAAPLDAWRSMRDQIHAEVCESGFDANRNTFTQSYGSPETDAALLLLPRVGFVDWSDPRMVGTVDAVIEDLSVDGLLLRYDTGANVDGLPEG